PTQDPSKDDASTSDDIDWAAAMAEQAAGTHQSNQAEGLAEAADDWAAALAEQTAAETAQQAAASEQAAGGTEQAHTGGQAGLAAAPSEATPAAGSVFKPLVDAPGDAQSDIDMIMDI